MRGPSTSVAYAMRLCALASRLSPATSASAMRSSRSELPPRICAERMPRSTLSSMMSSSPSKTSFAPHSASRGSRRRCALSYAGSLLSCLRCTACPQSQQLGWSVTQAPCPTRATPRRLQCVAESLRSPGLSGPNSAVRINTGGNRQLNRLLHVIAFSQIRSTAHAGRIYYDRKRREGKTHRSAMRALKRQLCTVVYYRLRSCQPDLELGRPARAA